MKKPRFFDRLTLQMVSNHGWSRVDQEYFFSVATQAGAEPIAWRDNGSFLALAVSFHGETHVFVYALRDFDAFLDDIPIQMDQKKPVYLAFSEAIRRELLRLNSEKNPANGPDGAKTIL